MSRVRLFCILFLAASCKQFEGDRCQTDADCDPPLVCSIGDQQVCRMSGTGIVSDAAPAFDSRFDARRFDANLDPLVPDANIDAPAPDAALVDAAVSTPDAPEPTPDAQ